jgi:hypothetical protein
MPNGGAPGVPPGTEAGAAGVPLGEFALLDVDRRRRTGVPEVVFGEGKTSEQIFALLAELRARDPEAPALATRCPVGVLDGAATRFPGDAVHADHVAGTVAVGALPPARGNVLVVTAGTTDLKVARECAATLAVLGVRADVLADVGVAGLGRLLSRLDDLRAAECLVVVAGMDGALPSVVAGLVSAPVIGVPTSVGYGVAAGGLAAACSPRAARVWSSSTSTTGSGRLRRSPPSSPQAEHSSRAAQAGILGIPVRDFRPAGRYGWPFRADPVRQDAQKMFRRRAEASAAEHRSHANGPGQGLRDPLTPALACCCPARPMVKVVMPETPGRSHPVDLWLCGHHYSASRQALAAAGARVYHLAGPRPRPRMSGVSHVPPR